jgi:hypothetical protein
MLVIKRTHMNQQHSFCEWNIDGRLAQNDDNLTGLSAFDGSGYEGSIYRPPLNWAGLSCLMVPPAAAPQGPCTGTGPSA